MILSIVTGTYNRSASLQRMVASARANIPTGMDYEFVIVDGGSTDDTLAWCRQQADVRLIEHGGLRGAVAAFCDGAKAARGDYVLLANDDIEFMDGSIVPAIVALEADDTRGCVAFADNRPAPGYEGHNFKVQTIQALRGGAPISVPYAQVGLYRREIGNQAGWWGADDPAFQGHTYGGDCYLSARIWEMGYSVIELSPCKIVDHVTPDGLRDHNYQVEQQRPGEYYKRFPKGPQIPANAAHYGSPERLRVLYMPIYERGYGQYKRGLRDAFQRIGLVWEIDYINHPYDLVGIMRQFQPHILLTQCHSFDDVSVQKLAEARAVCPGLMVINWNGDVYEQHLTSPEMLAFLRHFDLQLTVNADVLPVYAQHNIPAAYWQVAWEPVDERTLPAVKAHDVVFLANAYTAERKALGQALRAMPNLDVGLYGYGWDYPDGICTYDFARGRALYQQARIAIGDNQYHRRGFVSNRLFEAIASGVLLLHETIPGLEELTGLKDGVHYVAWSDIEDLTQKLHYWMDRRNQPRYDKIVRNGQQFVLDHHSFDARVRELLLDIVPKAERVTS